MKSIKIVSAVTTTSPAIVYCCYDDGFLLCTLQGAEIISQSSRIEAEDEASSDDDKSLPEDSASDSDNVCICILNLFCFVFRELILSVNSFIECN